MGCQDFSIISIISGDCLQMSPLFVTIQFITTHSPVVLQTVPPETPVILDKFFSGCPLYFTIKPLKPPNIWLKAIDSCQHPKTSCSSRISSPCSRRSAICHHPGQIQRLGNPSAVLFLFDFHEHFQYHSNFYIIFPFSFS